MKRIFMYALLPLMFMGCGNSGEADYINLSDRIVDKFLDDMFIKYGLICYGRGGGYLEKVNEIAISLETRGPMTLDELRDLLVIINEDLLNRFNDNEKIRPYLKNFPFNSRNISIGILLTNKEGISFNHIESENGKLCSAKMFWGEIVYSVGMAEKPPYSRELRRESYEEALAIVKAKNPDLFSY